MVRSHSAMVLIDYLPKKSLVVVVGGRPNLMLAQVQVLGPFGPDLGPGPELDNCKMLLVQNFPQQTVIKLLQHIDHATGI